MPFVIYEADNFFVRLFILGIVITWNLKQFWSVRVFIFLKNNGNVKVHSLQLGIRDSVFGIRYSRFVIRDLSFGNRKISFLPERVKVSISNKIWMKARLLMNNAEWNKKLKRAWFFRVEGNTLKIDFIQGSKFLYSKMSFKLVSKVIWLLSKKF